MCDILSLWSKAMPIRDNVNNIPDILNSSRKSLSAILNQIANIQKQVLNARSKPYYMDLSDSMSATFKAFSKDLLQAIKGNQAISQAVVDKIDNIKSDKNYETTLSEIQNSLNNINTSIQNLKINPQIPQPTKTQDNNTQQSPNQQTQISSSQTTANTPQPVPPTPPQPVPPTPPETPVPPTPPNTADTKTGTNPVSELADALQVRDQQGNSKIQNKAEDIASSMLKGVTIVDAIRTSVNYISTNMIKQLQQFENLYTDLRENQRVTADTATKTLNNAISQRQKITEHIGIAVKTQTILEAQRDLLKHFNLAENSILNSATQELAGVLKQNNVQINRETLEFLNNQNLTQDEVKRLGEQLIIASSGENGRIVDMQKLFSDNEKLAQYMMNAQSNGIKAADAQSAYVAEVTKLVNQGMEQTMAQNAALSSLNVKLGNSYLELGNDKSTVLMTQIASSYLPSLDMQNKTISEIMEEVKKVASSSEEEQKRLNDTVNTLVKSGGIGSSLDGMNLQNFFNAQASAITSLETAKQAQNDSMSTVDKMFQGMSEWLQVNVGSHIQGYLFDANMKETEILSHGFKMIEGYLIYLVGKDGINGLFKNLKGNAGTMTDALKGISEGTKGIGGGIGKIGGMLVKAGAAVAVIAAIAVAIKSIYGVVTSWHKESQMHQNGVSATQELERLKEDLDLARMSGDSLKVKSLEEQIKVKDAEINRIALEEEKASDEKANNWGAIGGLGAGALLGLAGVALTATGVGAPLGLAMIAGGAALGGLAGYAITDAVTSEDTEEEQQKVIEKRRASYAEGGLITEEQEALIGEGGKHELILPLTNADRTKTLLDQAKASGQMDPSVRDMLYGQPIKLSLDNSRKTTDEEFTVIESLRDIINEWKDTWFSLYVGKGYVESEFEHYEDGGVVNKEQKAVIGEGGKTEIILPITNAERTKAVLEEAKSSEQMDPEVRKMLYGSLEKVSSVQGKVQQSDKTFNGKLTKGDLMVMAAGSQEGAPYDLRPHNGGFVCNELVGFAAEAANLVKDHSQVGVRNNWDKMQKGTLLTQGEARRGMIGFSGTSKKHGGPTHMGVLSDDDNWWNASGSNAEGTAYTYSKEKAAKEGKETFRATPTSKGTILSKMNKKNMRGFGYFAGTFDEAEQEDFAQFAKIVKSPYTNFLHLLGGVSGSSYNEEPSNVGSTNKEDMELEAKEDIKDTASSEGTVLFDEKSAKSALGFLLRDNNFTNYWGEQKHALGSEILNSVLTDFNENLDNPKVQEALERNSFDAEKAIEGDVTYNDYREGITSFGRAIETRFAQLKDMFIKDQIAFLTDKGILSREARDRMLNQKAIQDLTDSVKSLTAEVRQQNRNNDINNAKGYIAPPKLIANVAL